MKKHSHTQARLAQLKSIDFLLGFQSNRSFYDGENRIEIIRNTTQQNPQVIKTFSEMTANHRIDLFYTFFSLFLVYLLMFWEVFTYSISFACIWFAGAKATQSPFCCRTWRFILFNRSLSRYFFLFIGISIYLVNICEQNAAHRGPEVGNAVLRWPSPLRKKAFHIGSQKTVKWASATHLFQSYCNVCMPEELTIQWRRPIRWKFKLSVGCYNNWKLKRIASIFNYMVTFIQ